MASPWKADRLAASTTTIFSEMSALAVSTGAINLGQGFPDTDGPDFMLETARQAIADGVNQYPPGPGMPALRQAIVDHTERHYGLTYDPASEVLVTMGATEAISVSVLAFVNPGDEVIALEPFYDSYTASINLAGGVQVGVGLYGPDFRLDLDEFAAAFTPKTKAVLINSPHNPTGSVVPREQLAEIARLCVEHDVVVICDEVYEHLVYDDVVHVPLASFPGMRERTLRISSAGKTFSATGWKIGWALAPVELITEINSIKAFSTFTGGAPFQPAVARALNEGDEWVAKQRQAMQGKRDLLANGLTDIGMPPKMPQGTYFMTSDVRQIGYHDGLEFCRALPELCGVVAIPHQVFYANTAAGAPYVRWAFCKEDHILESAVERLGRLAR